MTIFSSSCPPRVPHAHVNPTVPRVWSPLTTRIVSIDRGPRGRERNAGFTECLRRRPPIILALLVFVEVPAIELYLKVRSGEQAIAKGVQLV